MNREGGGGIVFRDVMMLTLLLFVLLVYLVISWINKPTQEEAIDAPGNIIVEISWPPSLDVDVDLWVKAPGDLPVGYSRLNGFVFNLLRDDLGNIGDPLELNYENAYSRGVPEGDYIVNLHLYRLRDKVDNVPINVVVSKKMKNSKIMRLYTKKVELSQEGQEINVFHFNMSKEGYTTLLGPFSKSLRYWKNG